MTGTLYTFLTGRRDNLATVRFAAASGLLWSRHPFRVSVYPRTTLTLGRGVRVEGDGELHIGCDGGSFPRGTHSAFRMGAGARLVLAGRTRLFSGHQINVDDGATLAFGGKGYVNHDCKIDCKLRISIGNGSILAEDVTVMDNDSHQLDGSRACAPVEIGEHVWIGTRATVLKGVVLGDGCVVAAGALVTCNVAPGTLVAGVPARVLRERVTWQP